MHVLAPWLVLSLGAALPAQTLVGDINSQPPYVDGLGSNPTPCLASNGLFYFAASDSARGSQLWVTDGTTAGTHVTRMMPRDDLFQPQNFVDLNGIVLFAAYSMSEGNALWRSDGTAPGTFVLGHFTTPSLGFALRNLTALNGAVWFSASDGVHGEELWRSDGTIAGTAMVCDIDNGPESSMPMQFAAANGVVLFSAGSTLSDRELWRSDGTAAGTWRVLDIVAGPGGSYPKLLTSLPGGVLFAAYTPGFGEELWWSDGTAAGTYLVMDIAPGSSSSTLWNFVAVSGRVFFTAQTASGNELWSSDGTAAGTGIVLDIAPGAASSSPSQLTAFGNQLLFTADDGAHGRELWITDGTATGTVMVADLVPGPVSSAPLHIAAAGSGYWFDAALTASGRTLCFGTSSGVGTVRTFAHLDAIGAFGSRALLDADDGTSGPEPWITDGTIGGTSLLLDVNSTARGSSPRCMSAAGDDLLFAADDGVTGSEPWIVPAGGAPSQLLDIATGPPPSVVSGFVEYRGLHWFVAADFAHGTEIWRTDGTTAGTQLFADLVPGPASSNPTMLTVAADRLFFLSGMTLWATDGTAAGTVPLHAFFQRLPFPFPPGSLTAFAGRLFLTGDDAAVGVELWQSDGTAAGTTLFADVRTGGASSTPDRLTVAGNRLFFRAYTDTYGQEPWVTDGTTAGTHVIDLAPGGSSSFPTAIAAFGSRAFLAGGTGNNRLSITDGTVAGTVLLSSTVANPMALTVAGDRLYFTASDAAGREPWVSDGTSTGTFRLRDVSPGSVDSMTSSSTFGVAGSGARVVFGANDIVHGNDLWTSDGTVAGTVLLADIAPDVISSNPGSFVRAGLDLYFVADDYAHGAELWRLPLAQLQVPVVDSIAPGCAPIGGEAPRLSAVGLPVLGNPSFGLRLEGAAPTSFVLTAFQFAPSPPVPFAGCTLAVIAAVLLLDVTDAAGTQTTSIAIPPSTPLLGFLLFEQDIVLDANGPQGFITASNALRTMVGQ